MRQLSTLFLAVFFGMALTGCQSIWYKPVIEDVIKTEEGKYAAGTLSTTPDRRVFLIQLLKDKRVCAEPSADAAASISSTLQAMASADIVGQGKGSAQLASAFASQIGSIFTRSQGVQLYRDGLFNLCIAYINGAITKEQYATQSAMLLTHVVPLIKAELPTLKAPVTITTPAAPKVAITPPK
ncbi:hypothetical protein [Magnetococcus sp. PR-3]|uniref:hypothetical protein n=1 Tax=Magnetococcus sp. PR-3 TaxID=3120355 RepID=UPI002FCE507A